MNDEETAALTCGGHTVGKAHGAMGDDKIGAEPEGCPVHGQGLGWSNPDQDAKATNAFTSGVEGAWSKEPLKFDMGFFEYLFDWDWELTKSPAGAHQYAPVGMPESEMPVDPTDPSKPRLPVMTDADMAMKVDPIYNEICQKFMADPEYFKDTFARAWFKLTHRDMGPVSNLSLIHI